MKWAEGADYDAHWTATLFKAASIRPTFTLGNWHRLAAMPGPTTREDALDCIGRVQARHRARDDAEQLVLALARAVGAEVGPIENLDQRTPVLATLNGLKANVLVLSCAEEPPDLRALGHFR